MNPYKYEVHIMRDSRLPFIYHPCFCVTRRNVLPNWHENVEFLLCLAGAGSVRVGSETLPFTPGEVICINADTPHSIFSSDQVTYSCLIVDNSFFLSNGIPISEYQFPVSIREDAVRESLENVGRAYGRMEKNKEDPFAPAEIRLAVLSFLCLVCRRFAKGKEKALRGESNESVKHAMEYIRAHFARSLTLGEVSEAAGVSPYHLERLFKKFTGRSVISTVNLIRCTEARRMIEGGMSVSQAAFSCGFESPSYFTRSFRKYFDAPPSQYRLVTEKKQPR